MKKCFNDLSFQMMRRLLEQVEYHEDLITLMVLVPPCKKLIKLNPPLILMTRWPILHESQKILARITQFSAWKLANLGYIDIIILTFLNHPLSFFSITSLGKLIHYGKFRNVKRKSTTSILKSLTTLKLILKFNSIPKVYCLNPKIRSGKRHSSHKSLKRILVKTNDKYGNDITKRTKTEILESLSYSNYFKKI